MIIDLSYQTGRFLSYSKSNFFGVMNHYFHHMMLHIDIFFPLSFLFASLKVLSGMNLHHELTALRMGGISYYSLFRPFFIFSLVLMSFSLCNFQFFYPEASTKIEEFTHANLKKPKTGPSYYYQVALLENKTKLIFRDKKKNCYEDVFWIVSPKEVWHISQLMYEKVPIAKNVDKFKRKNKGFFKTESIEEMQLSKLKIRKMVKELSFESMPISELAKVGFSSLSSIEEKLSSQSHLYFKVLVSCLPLLLIVALFPFSLLHSRTSFFFLLLIISLFGFITCYAALDTAILLGENRVLAPWILFSIPFAVLFGIFTRRLFVKAQKI
jgi:lipopolysaccharide export LptBFGC system permease protein LptF